MPAGVLCNVANIHDIMEPSPICAARCVKRLARRLTRIERGIEVGSTTLRARRCRRTLRAVARVSRTLDRRASKLYAAGRIAPATRAERLMHEAARLDARADVLSRSFCTGP